MIRIMIILLVTMLSIPAEAQQGRDRGNTRSDAVYLQVGGSFGPKFSDFTGYVNSHYQPVKSLKNFGGNASLAFGYISRFHRNFGIDAGVSFYGLNSSGIFTDPNSAIPEARLSRRIEYKAALFTGTLPVYFEFSPAQKIVPYLGVGLSIFSMTLDDYFEGFISHDTRTAVGGHFQAGLGYKITPKLWMDLRGRWHGGNGHLATLEDNFRDFKVNQSVSQYSLGVDYFFR